MLDVSVITPPSSEPVDLATAKNYCRVEHDDEDALITALIATARATVEADTGRSLIEQTLEIRLDDWPTLLYLPRPPVRNIVSVTAIDQNGTPTVLDSGAYQLRTGLQPGYILFERNMLPTFELANFAGVRVRYTAGYGTAADVPKPLIQVMLMLISHWYAYREVVAPGNLSSLPFSVDRLLAPYRIYWFGDWQQ